MSKKLIFATVFTLGIIAQSLLLLAGIAGAAPFEEWNRTYSGAGNATASSVQQTADGGYLILGSTCSSYEPWHCSPWLLKTDTDGNEQWNKMFTGDYGARSLLQTADGGYIFADRSLVKVDVNGSEQWAKKIDGTIYSVQGTVDGGYIGAGIIPEVPGSEHPDGWLIKVDSNGDEHWNNTFRGMGFCMIESVSQTADGGYVIAGYRTAREEMGGSWLIKVDADGNEMWNRTFGAWNRTFGGRGEWANSVRQTTDGGYILAGRGFLLIKTDANGNMQWGKNKKFKGKELAAAHSARQTPDGGYIITGDAYSERDFVNKDNWLMKADENGNEQWNITFRGAQNSEAHSVRQTKDGGYIIAGTTFSSAGGSYAWLRKVGEEQTGTAKTPDGSPTETPIATPTQTLRASSNETQTVSPAEKIAGFEIILPIAILLAVNIIGRKRR